MSRTDPQHWFFKWHFLSLTVLLLFVIQVLHDFDGKRPECCQRRAGSTTPAPGSPPAAGQTGTGPQTQSCPSAPALPNTRAAQQSCSCLLYIFMCSNQFRIRMQKFLDRSYPQFFARIRIRLKTLPSTSKKFRKKTLVSTVFWLVIFED